MTSINRQYVLASRPDGMIGPEHFELTERSVQSDPGQGEILVRNLYISLDPAMRGWVNDARSYLPPVGIGEVMRAVSIARVVRSGNPGFVEGDVVSGMFGVQDYAVSDGKGVVKVDPGLAPLPRYLGTLGLSGMTAYFGLIDVGRPEAGQTVLVSGATGAVGQVVGQLARIKGCRVVGIAGGPAKCKHAVEALGYDACIDYKGEDVKRALRKHCPAGVDVYFDNVGGEILDAVLTRLAMYARIVICGAISQYNSAEVHGPKNYMSLLVHRASMTGMVVLDYEERYGDAVHKLAAWIGEGRLNSREDVVAGLEQFPYALLKLFRGENVGKLVLKVCD